MPYILQTDRLTKIIGEKELVRDVDPCKEGRDLRIPGP